MHEPSRRLTPLGEAVAGGASGGLTRALLSPLDVLKIRLQLHSAPAGGGALAVARGILAADGVRGFWRGSGTGIALWVAYMAVQFPAYQAARRALEASSGGGGSGSSGGGGASLLQLPPLSLLAGGLAGVAATAVTYPLDWARTRLAAAGSAAAEAASSAAASSVAARSSSSAAAAAAAAAASAAAAAAGPLHPLLRASGPLALFAATPPRQWYSGLLPSLYAIFPAMALTFYFYEALQEALAGALPPALAPARSLLAGGLGGGAAKLLTYPLDTVKKRMQVLPERYPSALRALRTIAGSAEGPAGLFKGLAPALAKAAASSALGFGCYEGVGGALAWAAVPGLALPGGGAE
jgi:hypothetical protein